MGITGRGNGVGLAADVIAVVTAVYAAVSLLVGAAVEQAILALALGFMALTFMFWNVGIQRRFAREAARVNAAQHLVSCQNHLRDATVALIRNDGTRYTVLVAEATKSLAAYFTAVTMQHCRVAVQDVAAKGDDVEDAEVLTFCRSGEVEAGSREAGLAKTAKVGQNTDFHQILTGKVRTFFSNDLTKIRRYENSHFDVTLPANKYPYRSTIVWPISGPSLVNSEGDPEIIGFLSVDSRNPKVFTRGLDVSTGRMTASALYFSLSLYQAIREREVSLETQEQD